MSQGNSKIIKIQRFEKERKASLYNKRRAENLTLNALQGRVILKSSNIEEFEEVIKRYNKMIRPKSAHDIYRVISKVIDQS